MVLYISKLHEGALYLWRLAGKAQKRGRKLEKRKNPAKDRKENQKMIILVTLPTKTKKIWKYLQKAKKNIPKDNENLQKPEDYVRLRKAWKIKIYLGKAGKGPVSGHSFSDLKTVHEGFFPYPLHVGITNPPPPVSKYPRNPVQEGR